MKDTTSLTGAHALVATLQAAGTRVIFSLSGNQIMPVYDALLGSGIRIVHTRHEAAAVYMAEAWAQLTGQVGVALVTAGAGLGNALGALISARASETPVLLLSGDSPRGQDGMGAFQELDQAAMAAPAAKAASRAARAGTLGAEVAAALRMARAGRPGPVHLALPADVLTDAVTALDPPAADSLMPRTQALDATAAAAIAAFLHGAERPLVLTGPALSTTRTGDAGARLQAALAAPVLCMESPRGLRDPALGALVEVTRRADRILMLGKASDFTTGFLGADMGAPGARFAVVDPEAAMIDRARARLGDRVQHAVRADALPALEALAAAAGTPTDRAGWLSEATEALGRRAPADDAGTGGLHPAIVCAAVQARLARAPGAVLVADGGEFGQWAQAMHHDGPRVINGVSGAIGGAPAYAIAASLARPGVPVFAMMGDGTAGFLLAEYETAAREGAAFVAVIGNDNLWNAEHQIQIREFGADRTHGCGMSPAARYDAAAAALGAHGEFVADGAAAALDAALERAQASGGPACVNVRIRPVPAPVVPSKQRAAEAVH